MFGYKLCWRTYFNKKSDLGRFVNKELTSNSNIYKELKSKHFLYENKNDIAIDLLALKKN